MAKGTSRKPFTFSQLQSCHAVGSTEIPDERCKRNWNHRFMKQSFLDMNPRKTPSLSSPPSVLHTANELTFSVFTSCSFLANTPNKFMGASCNFSCHFFELNEQVDHTPGSAMFETTKPATPGANSISARNSISFLVFYRQELSLCEKNCSLVLHPDSQQSFHFLKISFSLIVIDFEVLELIPALDIAFIFVYFLSRSSVWIIPLFLLLRKYCIFS